jgi:hypothetical protein
MKIIYPKEKRMYRKTVAAAVSMVLAVTLSPAYAAGTHLMQPTTASHVVLVDGYFDGGSKICFSASFKDRAFFRVFPDGTLSPEPFVVPKEQSLVVTDVEWAGNGLGGGPMLSGYTLRLAITLKTSASSARVFTSRGITLNTDSVTGRPGSSEQLTAGFVVGPGVAICPFVHQLQPASIVTGYADFITLRGYLVPDASSNGVSP